MRGRPACALRTSGSAASRCGTRCWPRCAGPGQADLVELLIGLIHRINARAERRAETELIGDLASVPGKRGIYTKMIDAALEHPDDTVRDAVYPAVPGGVKTLGAMARGLIGLVDI